MTEGGKNVQEVRLPKVMKREEGKKVSDAQKHQAERSERRREE